MSSTVAMIVEHGSRDDPKGKADPLMLLLRTLDVHSTDIAKVVRKIIDLRNLAECADPRLAPILQKKVKGYIYSLASLSSVGGKTLKYLTTTTQAYSLTERSLGQKANGLKAIIEGQQKPQETEIYTMNPP